MQQYLDDIELMTDAWIQNPKLRSDAQKKAFLGDYVAKSKAIGIESAVDAMIPCLVNAFHSDQVVHPDLYETHVTLLFTHLTAFIKFLTKNSSHSSNPSVRIKKLRRRSQEFKSD